MQSLGPVLVYSSGYRPRKWLGHREVRALVAGEIPGMEVVDVAAQMREYSRRLRWWELGEKGKAMKVFLVSEGRYSYFIKIANDRRVQHRAGV